MTSYANFLHQRERPSAPQQLRQAVAPAGPRAGSQQLAWLLGQQGQRDEAIALARRAVALAGDEADSYRATLNSLLAGR